MKNPADKIKRIGLIGNSTKAACADCIRLAARLIRAAGRQVCCDETAARATKLCTTIFRDARTLAREVDLIIVFGGDGTMLRLAREVAGTQTPILGINIGGLGFLTAVPSDQLAQALKHLWAGELKFEKRTLIEASTNVRGQKLQQAALNDIVISRGVVSRLIEVQVDVDGEPLTRYRCDGLIVSSPTGSTAYSLAAGGALVYPTADVFALTPICPHTLSNRSLILPLTSTIHLRPVSARPPTILSADGQVMTELLAGDVVTVRRSRHTVRLMHLADSSFFEALRRKLNWRGANL